MNLQKGDGNQRTADNRCHCKTKKAPAQADASLTVGGQKIMFTKIFQLAGLLEPCHTLRISRLRENAQP